MYVIVIKKLIFFVREFVSKIFYIRLILRLVQIFTFKTAYVKNQYLPFLDKYDKQVFFISRMTKAMCFSATLTHTRVCIMWHWGGDKNYRSILALHVRHAWLCTLSEYTDVTAACSLLPLRVQHIVFDADQFRTIYILPLQNIISVLFYYEIVFYTFCVRNSIIIRFWFSYDLIIKDAK